MDHSRESLKKNNAKRSRQVMGKGRSMGWVSKYRGETYGLHFKPVLTIAFKAIRLRHRNVHCRHSNTEAIDSSFSVMTCSIWSCPVARPSTSRISHGSDSKKAKLEAEKIGKNKLIFLLSSKFLNIIILSLFKFRVPRFCKQIFFTVFVTPLNWEKGGFEYCLHSIGVRASGSGPGIPSSNPATRKSYSFVGELGIISTLFANNVNARSGNWLTLICYF